ncbi:hypothetical protein ACTFIV_006966 [Dictyostelium citrinum]
MDKKINLDYLIDDIIVNSEDLSPFQCQICLNSVIDFKKETLSFDVLQCRNGHISCHECWNRQLAIKQECPSCKVKTLPNELSRNIFLENAFRALKVICPNKFKESKFQGEAVHCENGCPNILKVELLEHHLKECQYQFIKCPNNSNKCKYIIRKNQIEHHNQSVCEYSMIQCEKCSESIERNTFKKHMESECDSLMITCSKCSASIGKKLITHHLETDCPMEEISCLYKAGGCNKRFLRSQLSQHLTENNNHTFFIQNIMDLHKLQLDECNQDYRKLEKQHKELERRVFYLESTVNSTVLSSKPHECIGGGGGSGTNVYKGKWIINNWDRKLREYPISKSLNSPFFQIGSSKFFIMLYPNGNNEIKGFLSIFLYKIYDRPTLVKYSLEAKNIDPSKNYKNTHTNNFVNNNGNGWFKWIENKSQNGFFSNNSLTINISIKIIQDHSLVTD